MSEDPKNPFEPEPDFFSNPESFASEPHGEPMADFFDDADAISETGPLEPFPPVVEESVLSHGLDHEEHVESAATPPPRRTPPPPSKGTSKAAGASPSESKPNGAPVAISMLLLGGALMAGGMAVGKYVLGPETPVPAPSPSTPPAPETAKSSDAASAEELKGLAAKVDAFTKSLETQAKSIAGIQSKMDGLPKPAPATDLKPIETKINTLEGKVAELGSKPAAPASGAMPDLKPIETKVDSLTKTVGAVPSQIDALKAQLAAQEKTIATLKAQLAEKPATTTSPGSGAAAAGMPATPSPTTPAVDPEAALMAAINLYRQNQFGPARDAFVKLQSTAPNDARVWYYAALSNGFATNQWAEGSDTTRYASRGQEREKAGTPDKAKIDAALSDLRPDAKGWLDAYRNAAR